MNLNQEIIDRKTELEKEGIWAVFRLFIPTTREDGEEKVTAAVLLAAGFVQGKPGDFFPPAPTGWKPKQVKVVISGRVLEVNHDVAVQRIMQGIAELVVEKSQS
jgi:hypothetical protein